MKLITLDMETFYDREYSLSKISTEEYVRSSLFETIGIAIKIDEEETTWYPQPQVEAALKAIDWSEALVLCQNTMFDAAILAWRYGIQPAGLADTMCMSRALYPHEKSHSLKTQAERMGIGQKGDEVVAALGKRYKDFDQESLARYGAYCVNDVELTHTLFKRYLDAGFPRQELRLIDLTLKMFTDPRLTLDRELLKDHLVDVVAQKEALLSKLSADDKARLMSNPQLADMLREHGIAPPMKISPTTGKETYAFAKTDEAFKALLEHEDLEVQAIVAARLGVKSTLEETRTQRFIGISYRGPLPIALRYYGASTGRWSANESELSNMQNLPRQSRIKAAIKAPPGQVICGADLSNIELRLGLWLAGQDDRVQMLADGRDLYKDFAAVVFNTTYEDVTKDQRQVGKVSNLSLIYGTGAQKLREALRIIGGITMSVEETTPIVQLYRSRNARVAASWKAGEQALQAIATGQSMPLFRNGICAVQGSKGIQLPSGLHIQYPNLRRVVKDDGKSEWVFDSKKGVERVYGAKVFQGVTQAIARCIMAQGILKLQKKYPVRLTVHDSAYWLAPESEAKEALAFGIEAITSPVPYCPGLPLAAEGAYGGSLAEC